MHCSLRKLQPAGGHDVVSGASVNSSVLGSDCTLDCPTLALLTTLSPELQLHNSYQEPSLLFVALLKQAISDQAQKHKQVAQCVFVIVSLWRTSSEHCCPALSPACCHIACKLQLP